MSTYFHIGVRRDMMPLVVSTLIQLGHTPYVDGDGWEAWCDAPGVAGNDAETLHISIETGETSMTLLGHLSILSHKGFLVPMSLPFQEGLTVVKTDAADWSLVEGCWKKSLDGMLESV